MPHQPRQIHAGLQNRKKTTVTPLIQRFFSNPFIQRLGSAKYRNRPPLDLIQQALADALNDCDGDRATLIRYKIDMAQTPIQLWELRSDVHQCIARLHSERVAAARVNDIAGMFEGWIPANQLTRIQPGFRTSEK